MPRKLTEPPRTPAAYKSLAVTDDVHAKVEIWRRALSDYFDMRWTMSMTLDWLIDNVGTPEQALQDLVEGYDD